MDFAYSPKVQELRERVQAFMDAHVYPAEKVFYQQVSEGDRWQPTAIVEELKAKAKNPIAKHDTWTEGAPSGHVLNRFTDAVIDNIRHTLGQIEPATFDRACAMIADTAHPLYIVGGRITHTMAEYLFLHAQIIRPRVTHIQSTSNAWPHYLLDVGEGDVFVIFDVRRYENNTLKLAEMAHARGAKIILFTDQWRSPVHSLADICFSSRIVAPSAWDSAAATLLLMPALRRSGCSRAGSRCADATRPGARALTPFALGAIVDQGYECDG